MVQLTFNRRPLFDVSPTAIVTLLVVVVGVGLLSGGAGYTGSTQTTLFISGGVILGLLAIGIYSYFLGPQTMGVIRNMVSGLFSSSNTSPTPTTSPNPDSGFFKNYSVAILIGVFAILGTGSALFFSNGGTGTIINFAKYAGAFFGFFLLVLLLSVVSSKQERPGQFLPTALLRMLYYFLPYGLTTFATLSDMFNFEYKYFGGILTSIGAFITNYLLSKMVSGDQPTIDSNYCGIPGLSIFGSRIFPQGMLFNLTTLSYLATLLTLETNQNQKYTIPSWTFLIAVFGLSAFTTNYNECFNEKALNNHGYLIVDFFKSRNFSQNMGVTFLNMATLAAALGFGASGAAIHYFGVMRREAFAGHIDPKETKEAKDKQEENIVNVSTALSEVCPAISEDQIVAEIYQNGKKLGSSQN